MKKYALIALSQQSIPNILFIKKFETEIDHLIIIGSEEAERDFNAKEVIMNFIDKSKTKIVYIKVQAVDFHDVFTKLKSKDFAKKDSFLINLTGGTKATSLAIYTYFRYYSNASFYYSPIGKNSIYKLNTLENPTHENLNYKLCVKGYLNAYDISIPNKSSKTMEDKEAAIKMYSIYKDPNHSFKDDTKVLYDINGFKFSFKGNDIKKQLGDKIKLNQYFIDNKIDGVTFLKRIHELIKALVGKEVDLKTKWIKYLTGGWFEEYIYHHLRSFNVTDIKANFHYETKTEDGKTTNEIDIAFTHENKFYVIECKTSLETKEKDNIANDTIYKLDSLSGKMGLSAKKFLFTLDNETYAKENVQSRLNHNKIKSPHPDNLSPDKIDKTLEDLFKIKKLS